MAGVRCAIPSTSQRAISSVSGGKRDNGRSRDHRGLPPETELIGLRQVDGMAQRDPCQGSDKPGAHAVVVPLTHRPRTARLRADRNADLVKPPVEDIIRDFGIVWHQVAPQLGSRTRPG